MTQSLTTIFVLLFTQENECGQLIYHAGAKYNNTNIVALLLTKMSGLKHFASDTFVHACIDTSATNNDGLTAADLAQELPDILALLTEHNDKHSQDTSSSRPSM